MVNKKTFICIVVGMILLMLTMFIIGYHSGKKQTEKRFSIDTTTVVSSDYKAPKPVKEVGIGEVSVPLAIFPTSGKWSDSSKHLPDTAILCTYSHDIGAKDSLRVHIPLTQKEYRDSNYVAYVSGFMPKLDSIQIRSKVITRTITNTKTKFRTWNIGLTGGYGYGFTSHKFEPFLGVGVTLNLFR